MTNKESKSNPTDKFERKAAKEFGMPVAGIDEAGRGPWAGPVVAAAVILDTRKIPKGLNDSKKLSPNRRNVLFDEIVACSTTGIGIADVARIDEMNILHASLWAMREAVNMLAVPPAAALVDGNRAPDLECPAITIVKGDALSLSIAAASIVAKVTRDRIMKSLAVDYPCYGWEKNMGYGTKAHIEGIHQSGITEHHRRSFKPVRLFLERNTF